MTRECRLSNPSFLHLHDEEGSLYLGADQEWYPLLWQRKAGCGPTTASHLIAYHAKKNPATNLPQVHDKKSMTDLMECLWRYVTPGIMGTHLVSQFTNGVQRFFSDKHLKVRVGSLHLSKNKEMRPSIDTILDFLCTHLRKDRPIAFLNLHAGEVKNLDSWHWVTIVGLIQHDAGPAYIEVYDGSKLWIINITLWYETTTRSGGFACIEGCE
jgi:hypothetical protein